MMHPSGDLAEYVAGTLPDDRIRAVAAHLASCAECAVDVAGWQALAVTVDPPDPHLVIAALQAAHPRAAESTGPRWHLPLGMVRAQLRLIPWPVWGVSAAAAVCGAILSRQHPTLVSLFFPLVLAMGIAAVAEPDRGPVGDVVRATPTSVRTVLLCRVLLVAILDAAVGLPVPGLAASASAWLGPAVLLSGLAMLVAAARGAETAAVVTVTLWALRLFADQDLLLTRPVRGAFLALWDTNPWSLGLAVLCAGSAVIVAGLCEPTRKLRATTPT